MPQKSQNRPPVKDTHQLPSAYSYTVAMQNDDDDDICPVCESDCTCNNSVPPQPTQQPSQSLKIRLTVPPKLLSTLQNQARLQENQKQATSSAAQDGGAQPAIPTTIPKKRGRPTKAEAEARRLAALRAAELEAQQQRLGHGRPRASRVAGPSPTNKSSSLKKRQLATTQRRRSKKIIYPASSTESEAEGKPPSTYTTFASPFSVTKAAGLVESDECSSLSSLPDPGDESSLEAEEERYVIQTHEESIRVRLERLGGGGSEHRRTSRGSRESHTRSASSGLGDGMDEDTDSESESDVDEDDEDEDGDADEEADGDADADGEGEVDGDVDDEMFATRTFIYDSDDDEADADLFFASLSDSETSVAGFDHIFQAPMEEDDSDDTPVESVVPVDRVDPLDLFAPLSKIGSNIDLSTVLVSRDLNGMHCLTDPSDFAMGMLDIDFELSVVAQQQVVPSASLFPPNGVVDEDEEMWIPTEEDEQSDCGDTTDEDLVSMRGIQTPSGIVLFRVPTPPVSSIDPLSTLSPITKRKKSSAKKHRQFSKSKRNITLAPKDILHKSSSGVAQFPDAHESGTADDAASLDGASSISWVLKQPMMGHFEKGHDMTRQHIIINGENNGDIPSPVAQVARLRRGSGSSRGRKRTIVRDGSPFSLASRGQARSPLPSRSRSVDDRKPDESERVTPEFAVPAKSIELSDVLDATLLDNLTSETEEEQSGPDGASAGKYIGRWDRVPMGTFRRTRNAAGISPHLEPVLEWAPHHSSGISDGFCYGSPGGSLMRSGPLFATSSDANWHHQHHESSGDKTPTPFEFAFGNTPPETPPKILSHKERRKERRRQLGLSQS